MSFNAHRPTANNKTVDKYLPPIIHNLRNELRKWLSTLKNDTLRLSNIDIKELATVLVEFAEDTHNEIGIWRSLEKYNSELFGKSLPFNNRLPGDTKNKFNEYRICHLLWVLYPEIKEGLILSTTHPDLNLISKKISGFLRKHFTNVPKESSVKSFFDQPNQYGWDVKRKLIWLGKHSYFFRYHYQNYIVRNGGKGDIPTTDDFLCQETTSWSGLGVIDILAFTLNIDHQERLSLRSWYERHFAYYKVVEIIPTLMRVMNIINDKPYKVRIQGNLIQQFKKQQIIYGGLVPWKGEWYWSGAQSVFNNAVEETIKELKQDFIQKASRIAYRYSPKLAERARERNQFYYREFIKYHGDDLTSYPDGLSMAADLQKMYRLQYEAQPKKAVERVIKKHNLKNPWPRMSYPPQLLEHKNGVGIYYNPKEGLEFMEDFNDLLKGFKKKGKNLNEDELDTFVGFICSESISPEFVRKLIERYGDQSIRAAFLIESDDESDMEYLLRSQKGEYFRNRFPTISFA